MKKSIFAENICKDFAHKKALKNVLIEFKTGEIHSLLGENGAGKSTLVNILAGLKKPTFGTLKINDEPVFFNSPLDAQKNGIAMVHQHPHLSNEITLCQNILLGFKSNSILENFLPINYKKIEEEINSICKEWNIEIDLSKKTSFATASQRFYTAFICALVKKPSILILDEPTAVLQEKERKDFLLQLRQKINCKHKNNFGVIFITHNLEDSIAISDRITVLKSGEVIKTFLNTNNSLKTEEIMSFMFKNEKIKDKNPETYINSFEKKETALLLENIYASPIEKIKLTDVTIEAKFGEITLIKGEKEGGLDTLEDIISGMFYFSEKQNFLGNYWLLGEKQKEISPKILRKKAVALVSSKKYFRSTNPLLTVQDVLTPFEKNYKEKTKIALEIIEKAKVDIAPNELVKNLSGGMLQKLIIERELSQNPKILILANPLYGLDKQTTNSLEKKIQEQAQQGKAVIILTSDTEEGLSNFDICYTLVQGKIDSIKQKDVK